MSSFTKPSSSPFASPGGRPALLTLARPRRPPAGPRSLPQATGHSALTCQVFISDRSLYTTTKKPQPLGSLRRGVLAWTADTDAQWTVDWSGRWNRRRTNSLPDSTTSACMRFSLFHSDSDSSFHPRAISHLVTCGRPAGRSFLLCIMATSVPPTITAGLWPRWRWLGRRPAHKFHGTSCHAPRTTVNLDGVRCGSEHRSKAKVAASSSALWLMPDGAFFFRQRAEHHRAMMTTTTPAARLKTEIFPPPRFSTRGRKSSCYGIPAGTTY